MRLPRVVALVSFFLGVMTLVVIAVQLGVHMAHSYSVVNFFSYFTNLSNLFVAVVLIVDGILRWRGKSLPLPWQLVRCCSVTCIVLVGVVFTALLRGVELGALLPWVNVWLHYVTPIAVLVIWLIAPPRRPLPYKALGAMLLVPAAYLAYSLIRGALTRWYPYPFLNPANGGFGAVAATCVGIGITFVVVTALLIAAGNARRNGLEKRRLTV